MICQVGRHKRSFITGRGADSETEGKIFERIEVFTMIERGEFYVINNCTVIAHDYERIDGYYRM